MRPDDQFWIAAPSSSDGALAQRQVCERDVARARVDLEEPVHADRVGVVLRRRTAVDDRAGGAVAANGHRSQEVEVAGRGSVVVDDRDLELERARESNSMVSRPESAFDSWIAARSVHLFRRSEPVYRRRRRG